MSPTKPEGTATALRPGPAADPGEAPAWLLFLCSEHSGDLPGWPGTAAATEDRLILSCGAVLDYRTTEQVLQSHADLWLTPLTGVDPAAYGGAWADVLDQADRVLLARVEEAAAVGGDSPLQNMLATMDVARQAAARGDLGVAATALGYCETFAQLDP